MVVREKDPMRLLVVQHVFDCPAGLVAERAAARGWALFLFNLGVEIGQLIFVGSVLLLMTALKRLLPRINLQSGAITVALGAIAVYWTLDRIDIWLQASLAIPHLGA